MKRALREIADHNTAGSNDAPATARAAANAGAARRAAEEPSARLGHTAAATAAARARPCAGRAGIAGV